MADSHSEIALCSATWYDVCVWLRHLALYRRKLSAFICHSLWQRSLKLSSMLYMHVTTTNEMMLFVSFMIASMARNAHTHTHTHTIYSASSTTLSFSSSSILSSSELAGSFWCYYYFVRFRAPSALSPFLFYFVFLFAGFFGGSNCRSLSTLTLKATLFKYAMLNEWKI